MAVFAANGQGGGSGVVISPDGYALSNFHVTREAGDAMKCGMADGKLYDAVIVGIDPTGDVALIKLLGRDDFPHAELADSDKVRAGDWCFAIGNPFLLATDFKPTVSYGVISGVHRYQYPVGHAAGIHRLLAGRRGDQSRQLGRSAVRCRRAADRHQRPRLVREARPRERRRGLCHLDQPDQEFPRPLEERPRRRPRHARRPLASDEHRPRDRRRHPDRSDAFRRGLRYGDEMLSFGGRPISTVNGFKNVLGILSQGLARAADLSPRRADRTTSSCGSRACTAKRNWPTIAGSTARKCRRQRPSKPDQAATEVPKPKAA